MFSTNGLNLFLDYWLLDNDKKPNDYYKFIRDSNKLKLGNFVLAFKVPRSENSIDLFLNSGPLIRGQKVLVKHEKNLSYVNEYLINQKVFKRISPYSIPFYCFTEKRISLSDVNILDYDAHNQNLLFNITGDRSCLYLHTDSSEKTPRSLIYLIPKFIESIRDVGPIKDLEML